ncbi:MAG: hypothetical protein AAGB34_01800 [Planctomycetota bacterium]
MKQQDMKNQRSDDRQSRYDTIIWRPSNGLAYQAAWLLELSEGGCAFAWRGAGLPKIGSTIDLRFESGASFGPPEPVVVKRVNVVHDNLVVVASQRQEPHLDPLPMALPSKPPEAKRKVLPDCVAHRSSMAA